jgi:hypothetical protein
VNVALPVDRKALDFSRIDLQWVHHRVRALVSAASCCSAAAGRPARRRRLFIVRVVAALPRSIAQPAASSQSRRAVLIASPAVQGLGGAIMLAGGALDRDPPRSTEGRGAEQGASASGAPSSGSGAAVGVLLPAPSLTPYASLGADPSSSTVPVGAIRELSSWRSSNRSGESRVATSPERHFGPASARSRSPRGGPRPQLRDAILARAPFVGWATARTIGLLLVARRASSAAFPRLTSDRVAHPRMPFHIFRVAHRRRRQRRPPFLARRRVLSRTFFVLTPLRSRTGLGFLRAARSEPPRSWANRGHSGRAPAGDRPVRCPRGSGR